MPWRCMEACGPCVFRTHCYDCTPAALIDRTTLANAILEAARNQYADAITFHFNTRLSALDPATRSAAFEQADDNVPTTNNNNNTNSTSVRWAHAAAQCMQLQPPLPLKTQQHGTSAGHGLQATTVKV